MERICGWMRPRRLRFGSHPSVRSSGPYLAGHKLLKRPQDRPSFVRWRCSTPGRQRSARNGFWRRCARRSASHISNEIVQEDIKALYKTGSFETFASLAQPEGDGVKVIIAVPTRAIIREIEVTAPNTSARNSWQGSQSGLTRRLTNRSWKTRARKSSRSIWEKDSPTSTSNFVLIRSMNNMARRASCSQ